MKDFQALIKETKEDLDTLGIKYGNVTKWSVNTRAKKRWGQCKRVSFNTFEINISALLLDDNVNDQTAKNVIAHELLHTVKGCFAHKGKWKLLAKEINESLPHYNIKTTDKFEDIGTDIKPQKPKYIISCDNCSFKAERYKMSRVIKYPYRYRCPKCNGKLIITNLSEGKQ